MNEKLLQFIWQYSLYLPAGMVTAQGEQVTVIFCGRLNRDAGPDFLEARVKIADTILVGNVELHLKSSDWNKHGHQHDAAYKNIILHVVYENDTEHELENVPVLEIKDNIPATVIAHYYKLMQHTDKIPCGEQHTNVKEIVKEAWLNRLLAERWEHKLTDWNIMLDNTADDWRNLLYWRMAANFGFKVNAAPFLELARSLPLNILARHRDNMLQLEALIFGQAGMLEGNFEDEYPDKLQGEYLYLKQKYKLQPLHGHLWKFLRMRPANFPTVRIAQFAALIHQSVHLFSQIIETHTVAEIEPLLSVAASEYWNKHFRFDEPQKRSTVKKFGLASVQNVIINTVAPIQFLYATRQAGPGLCDKALQLLGSVPAEQNNIMNLWQRHGWEAKNAAESQAMIQLYNNYCSGKRCLDCSIGLSLMRTTSEKQSL